MCGALEQAALRAGEGEGAARHMQVRRVVRPGPLSDDRTPPRRSPDDSSSHSVSLEVHSCFQSKCLAILYWVLGLLKIILG